MLTVSEAQAIVSQHVSPLPAEIAAISSDVLGQIIAEDVSSDLDMPPYDKSMMDGYAVRAADVQVNPVTLAVIEEVMAGQTPAKALKPGQATRIMTGAPIPQGADAVIPVEQTKAADDDHVQIESSAPSTGHNILPQGREMRKDEVVLPAGTVLRPQVFGLLATVGRTAARVYPRPRVAILSTGDEVVDASRVPGPGQIRNGNGPMLLAQAARAGGLPRLLGIARDSVDSLKPLIQEGLEAAILILSGGVSAGKLDLVPGVLEELDVRPHFHKVQMKPGKPVYFGTREGQHKTLVFGLPGNPVSSLVCFELFVGPAIRGLMGYQVEGSLPVLPLGEDYHYKTDRPTYYPAKLERTGTGELIRPVPWFGSADLRALAGAHGFVLFPAGDHTHRAGERFPFLSCDG